VPEFGDRPASTTSGRRAGGLTAVVRPTWIGDGFTNVPWLAITGGGSARPRSLVFRRDSNEGSGCAHGRVVVAGGGLSRVHGGEVGDGRDAGDRRGAQPVEWAVGGLA
jgi:hypothetical protein